MPTDEMTLLTDFDLHLFNEGRHDRLYEKLGAHPVSVSRKAANERRKEAKTPRRKTGAVHLGLCRPSVFQFLQDIRAGYHFLAISGDLVHHRLGES